MGTTNYGNQIITSDFRMPLTSEEMGKIDYKLREPGIYEGGTLTKINDTTVEISPLVCYIRDDDYVIDAGPPANQGLGVRVVTLEAQQISVTTSTIYIVLRYIYAQSENNFMDMLSVTYASIEPDDLIVGRCVFDGVTLLADFDYTRRSIPINDSIKENRNNFRVQSTEPISNQVFVNGGNIRNVSSYLTVSSGNSPVITDTTDGRIDLIWVDVNGDIQVVEGIDSVTPTEPEWEGRFVVATIERGASRNNIRGSEITQVYYPYEHPSFSLQDSKDYWNGETIQQAIEDITTKAMGFSKEISTELTGMAINKGEPVFEAFGELGTGSDYTWKKLGDAFDTPTPNSFYVSMEFKWIHTSNWHVGQGFSFFNGANYTTAARAAIHSPTDGNSIVLSNQLSLTTATSTSVLATVKLENDKFLVIYDKGNGITTLYGRRVNFDGVNTITADSEFTLPFTADSNSRRNFSEEIEDNIFVVGMRSLTSGLMTIYLLEYDPIGNSITVLSSDTVTVLQFNEYIPFVFHNRVDRKIVVQIWGSIIDIEYDALYTSITSTIRFEIGSNYFSTIPDRSKSSVVTPWLEDSTGSDRFNSLVCNPIDKNTSKLKFFGLTRFTLLTTPDVFHSGYVAFDCSQDGYVFNIKSPVIDKYVFSVNPRPFRNLQYNEGAIINKNILFGYYTTRAPDFHWKLLIIGLKNDNNIDFFYDDLLYDYSDDYANITPNGFIIKENQALLYDALGEDGLVYNFYQIPLLRGIADETVSSGNAIRIVKKGVVRGLSGLQSGETYGINIQTGELELYNNDLGKIIVGKALSETELYVDLTNYVD